MPDPLPNIEDTVGLIIDQATYDLITKQFGKAAADAAMVYIPAIRSMGITELKSYVELHFAGKTAEQLDTLRKLMTAEQLADEKTKLAEWTAMLADERAEQRQIGNLLISAALKAALTVALPATGLV